MSTAGQPKVQESDQKGPVHIAMQMSQSQFQLGSQATTNQTLPRGLPSTGNVRDPSFHLTLTPPKSDTQDDKKDISSAAINVTTVSSSSTPHVVRLHRQSDQKAIEKTLSETLKKVGGWCMGLLPKDSNFLNIPRIVELRDKFAFLIKELLRSEETALPSRLTDILNLGFGEAQEYWYLAFYLIKFYFPECSVSLYSRKVNKIDKYYLLVSLGEIKYYFDPFEFCNLVKTGATDFSSCMKSVTEPLSNSKECLTFHAHERLKEVGAVTEKARELQIKLPDISSLANIPLPQTKHSATPVVNVKSSSESKDTKDIKSSGSAEDLLKKRVAEIDGWCNILLPNRLNKLIGSKYNRRENTYENYGVILAMILSQQAGESKEFCYLARYFLNYYYPEYTVRVYSNFIKGKEYFYLHISEREVATIYCPFNPTIINSVIAGSVEHFTYSAKAPMAEVLVVTECAARMGVQLPKRQEKEVEANDSKTTTVFSEDKTKSTTISTSSNESKLPQVILDELENLAKLCKELFCNGIEGENSQLSAASVQKLEQLRKEIKQLEDASRPGLTLHEVLDPNCTDERQKFEVARCHIFPKKIGLIVQFGVGGKTEAAQLFFYLMRESKIFVNKKVELLQDAMKPDAIIFEHKKGEKWIVYPLNFCRGVQPYFERLLVRRSSLAYISMDSVIEANRQADDVIEVARARLTKSTQATTSSGSEAKAAESKPAESKAEVKIIAEPAITDSAICNLLSTKFTGSQWTYSAGAFRSSVTHEYEQINSCFGSIGMTALIVGKPNNRHIEIHAKPAEFVALEAKIKNLPDFKQWKEKLKALRAATKLQSEAKKSETKSSSQQVTAATKQPESKTTATPVLSEDKTTHRDEQKVLNAKTLRSKIKEVLNTFITIGLNWHYRQDEFQSGPVTKCQKERISRCFDSVKLTYEILDKNQDQYVISIKAKPEDLLALFAKLKKLTPIYVQSSTANSTTQMLGYLIGWQDEEALPNKTDAAQFEMYKIPISGILQYDHQENSEKELYAFDYSERPKETEGLPNLSQKLSHN